jgi:ATP-dependent Clp protease ATP-binding subunit ClpC
MLSWLLRLLGRTPALPYTWRAQWALHVALGRARERGAARAGDGDLLYALARTDTGAGRTALANLGVCLDDLIGPDEGPLPPAPPSRRSQAGGWDWDGERVLKLARAEAARAGRLYVGTEHLVLGLLRHSRCEASRLLRERGATLRAAREAIHKANGESV